MKKIMFCVFLLPISLFILVGCSNNDSIKAGNQTLYSTDINKIKADSSGSWVVTGTTTAPDGAKILSVPTFGNYKANAATSYDINSWARVKNGKFKVYIDSTINSGSLKSGDKKKFIIFAVTKYKKAIDAVVPKNIQKKVNKQFSKTTAKVTSSQEAYSSSLEDYLYSDSSSDSSSSVENSSSSVEDSSSYDSSSSSADSSISYQAVTFDQIARNPDDYEYKGVKVQGQVMQVQNSDDGGAIVLLWMNDDSNSLIMVNIDEDYMPANGNILEDDEIIINGLGNGTQKYDTASGSENEVPLIEANETITDSGKSANAY
ncbi:hypothetical protein [Liquorilactobacillus mali]|nr:hypothetical protein [Liquorilactobacillus mali]